MRGGVPSKKGGVRNNLGGVRNNTQIGPGLVFPAPTHEPTRDEKNDDPPRP
jgi:hypothetical protein